ncbi:MAG: cytochrome c biogenesis protein CcsA [Magnetococcales bacterium]|nr:cytochrome c biogenesis protein CcsA [Magnetococcales bacterium]
MAEHEIRLLWLALSFYVAAGCLAILAVVFGRRPGGVMVALLACGSLLHAASLGVRWERLGHGPFGTQFEILSSNLWSLTLAFTLVCWRMPVIRSLAAPVTPMLFMMMAWMMLTHPGDAPLPATYDTVWLYIHIGFGKVFLGAAMVASGISGVILGRMRPWGERWFRPAPPDEALDELAYRCTALGLIFDTLMLVAGAIWAQKAWGRYWSWDPLETWSLITWLLMVLAVHIRPLFQPAPRLGALLSLLIFAAAFLTFFGVPFVSTAAHQGVV